MTGMMGNDEGLLTEQDVARVLEVSLSTLRRWQREGTGPPCFEIGRQVRYRQAAVERWSTGSMQAGSPTRTDSRAQGAPMGSKPPPAPAPLVARPRWKVSPGRARS